MAVLEIICKTQQTNTQRHLSCCPCITRWNTMLIFMPQKDKTIFSKALAKMMMPMIGIATEFDSTRQKTSRLTCGQLQQVRPTFITQFWFTSASR